MEKKQDIRKDVLQKRNQLTMKEWEENSRIVYEKVITHPFFLKTKIIYCYIDYQKEIGTKDIIETAFHLSKEVRVPKIVNGQMHFYPITSLDELEIGYKGILEPRNMVEKEVEDGLILVPGVAFDRTKNRIGYGKGFYDRFLAKYPELKTIAIAHELQVLDAIPYEENDRKPEILMTEEKIYV